MLLLILDFETRSTIDLREVGACRYAAHRSTDILCAAYAVEAGDVKLWKPGDMVPPEIITAATDPEWSLAAFNANFERQIWQHVLRQRGWPVAPISKWRCLQATALAHALPASLKGAADALELTARKADNTVMKELARPREDGSWRDDSADLEALYEYCRQDVAVERELAHRLAPLSPAEQALWELDQAVNDRGFHIDRTLLEGALSIADAAATSIMLELADLTRGAVTSAGQADKIIAWLAARGCAIADVKKRTIAAALRRKNLASEVRRVLELRQAGAHAAAAKLETISAWRCPDTDRVRGAFRFHGAATGRWTSLGVQVQNLKKPETADLGSAIEHVLSGNFERMRSVYPDPLSVVGDTARALVCAAPGNKLIVADLSGIESRVVAWLSGQQSKLQQWRRFDETGDLEDDPYYRFGRDRLGLPPEEARAKGKIADLAFGYLGGVGAWKNFAPEDNASTEDEIRRVQQLWRADHPEIIRYAYLLDRCAIDATRMPGKIARANKIVFEHDGTFLFMTLPSGRRIAYPFAKLMTNSRGNPAVTFKDSAGGKWTDCRHGLGAYGGIFIENAVQAIARDLFAAAMPRLEAAGYRIVLHVHDEIAAEVPLDFGSVDEFERLLVELPGWAAGLPVAAKVRNGPRFAKISPPLPEAPQDLPPQDPAGEVEDDPPPEDPDPDELPPEAPPNGSARPNSGNGDAERAFADYTAENRRQHNGPSWQEAAYIYRLANGEPYLRVLKRRANDGRKWFVQQHVENGAWADGAPKGPRIPYRLPELLAAPSDAPIWATEGEKDAETLAALGLVATTNPEGAGKWPPEFAKWFVGRRVVYVLEDNDDAGRAHAARVAAALAGTVPEIKIVAFRDLPGHGDVTDWLGQGHTCEELLERAAKAPPCGPAKLAFLDIRSWDRCEVPRQEWAVPERFPLRQTVILSGEGGEGKSLIVLQQAAAHALGREWLDVAVEPGPAIVIDAEDDERVLHYRLAAVARHYGATFAELANGGLHVVSLVGDDSVLAAPALRSGIIEPTARYRELLEMAGDIKPKMIGIASSADVFAGSEVDRSQVRQFIRLLTRIAIVAGGVVVLISHPSLTGIASGSGLSGSTQWHNSVRARAVIKSVKPGEGEPVVDGLRQIEFRKNNYGPISATIFVRYQGGLFLPVPMTSKDEAARAQQAEDVFLSLLVRLSSQGQDVSAVSGTNYAPAVFARHPDAAGLQSKDFRDAMQRLLDGGKIKLEPFGPPSRNRKRLVRVD